MSHLLRLGNCLCISITKCWLNITEIGKLLSVSCETKVREVFREMIMFHFHWHLSKAIRVDSMVTNGFLLWVSTRRVFAASIRLLGKNMQNLCLFEACHLASLTSLHVEDYSGDFQENILTSIVSSCSMKEFVLSAAPDLLNDDFQAVVECLSKHCPQLTKCTFCHCPEFEKASFVSLVRDCIYLTEFNLSGPSVTDYVVAMVVIHCAHLRTLRLVDCSDLTDLSLRYFSQCVGLEVLSICGAGPGVTNMGMYLVLTGCQFLRSLDISGSSFCDEDTFHFICLLASQLTSLNISNLKPPLLHPSSPAINFPKLGKMEQILTQLTKSCSGITDLDVSNTERLECDAIADNMHFLRRIKIGSGRYKLFARLVVKFCELTTFGFSEGLLEGVPCEKGVQSVTFTGKTEMLLAIIPLCVKLVKLDFDCPERLTVFEKFYPQCCSCLVEIACADQGNDVVVITDEELLVLARHTGLLETIKFSPCRHITDSGLCAVVQSNPRLSSVNLCACVEVTDKSVVFLTQTCPRLEYLNVSHTTVTDLSIAVLSARSGCLHEVRVNCTAVSQEAVDDLWDSCAGLRRVGRRALCEVCARNRPRKADSCCIC